MRQHVGILALALIIAFSVSAFGFAGLGQKLALNQENGIAGGDLAQISASEPQGDVSQSASDDDFESSSMADVDKELGYIHDEVLISVGDEASLESVNEVLASCDFALTKDVSSQDFSLGYIVVELAEGTEVPAAIDALETETGFEAQPNFVYTIAEGGEAIEQASEVVTDQETPTVEAVHINDGATYDRWQLDSIDVYNAWGIQKCEGAAAVAVIDTGCNTSHEDLKDNITATYNSNDGKAGDIAVKDLNGHGTHVAGIVGAEVNNGLGVAGVSYNADLVIIKATIDSSGSNFSTMTLAKGYDWLMSDSDGNGQTIAQEHNVRVVNMSVGGYAKPNAETSEDRALYSKITQAKNQGILTVCAAGNAPTSNSSGDSVPAPYPAIPGDYDDCLSVINLDKGSAGALVNDSGGMYSVHRYDSGSLESNYNEPGKTKESSGTKDISAPGTMIYSTTNDGGYNTKTGTSMASPCVAGVAALVFANNPELDAQQVMDLLEGTATDIGDEGWDCETGYGEVDAYHALQVASAKIEMGNLSYRQSVPLKIVAGDASDIDVSEWTWSAGDTNIVRINEAQSTATAISCGKTTVTASLKAMPSVSISHEVTVGQIDLTDVTIEVNGDFTYNAAAHTPSLAVTCNGVQLKKGIDYFVAYTDNVDAGMATATITGKGGYTGSRSAQFAIKKCPLAQADIQIADQVYAGMPCAPSPFVTLGSMGALEQSVDYTVSFENNANVGTARVTITGMGNFTGSKSQTFNIVAADEAPAPIPAPDSAQNPSPQPDSEPQRVPEPDVSLDGISMYRLYNPNSGEHLYTQDVNEKNTLLQVGWRYEGLGWTAPKSSSTPVYRLYNPNSGDHHYTVDHNEYDKLAAIGWRQEGVGWYSDDAKNAPLYRVFNPHATVGTHHYTTDRNEYDTLPVHGWVQEGVAWYGM